MSIRTLLPRYPADPVFFLEGFLIDPDTGKPFDLLDYERELLRSPINADLQERLTYLGEELKYRSTILRAIYLITTLVLFRDHKPEVFSASCDRINREFEMIQRIVESSSLLLAEATITPEQIIIAGSVHRDSTQACINPVFAGRYTGPKNSCQCPVWA
jgi:hypothetical protein